MVAIRRISEDERVALIPKISSHLCDYPYLTFRHHSQPGDLLVWDNRTVIHSATLYHYEGFPSLLHHSCGSGRQCELDEDVG